MGAVNFNPGIVTPNTGYTWLWAREGQQMWKTDGPNPVTFKVITGCTAPSAMGYIDIFGYLESF